VSERTLNGQRYESTVQERDLEYCQLLRIRQYRFDILTCDGLRATVLAPIRCHAHHCRYFSGCVERHQKQKSAARHPTNAADIEKLRNKKNSEIATLNSRITDLGRKPYTEELKRITQQVLHNEMTLEGRHVLRQLMIHEPVEVGRVFFREIPQDRQQAQLAIATQRGIVQHREERYGLSFRTNWIVNPQFRSVLEDVLFESGE
jgi:hypothetical protein